MPESFCRTVLLAITLLGLAAGSTVAQAAPGRPLILLVHGRGQFGRDTAQVRREAASAIQRSIRALGGDPLIADDDVRLVWYADVLDGHSTDDARDACSAGITRGAVTTRDTTLNAITMLASLASAFLDVASADATGDESNELRSIAGDLRFFGRPAIRCAAEARVGDALARAQAEHRPVILVSHSLGALVSWRYLSRPSAAAPTPQIARWITLGSPLGAAEVRQLIFDDSADQLAVPATVGSWVNVLGAGDGIAMSIMRDGSVDTSRTARMSEVKTEASHAEPHLLASYLSDPATVRALVGGWCDALGSSGRDMAVCKPVHR
ncbi:MAG: hypothetical protein ABJE47_01460 [bacterium]